MMKIILVILVLAMVMKLVQIGYQASRKWKIEQVGLKNNVSMIRNNLAFSYSFEKKKPDKTSELKKILVAELAVFSGAEEELMEQENQEEVLDFEEAQAEPIPESSPEEAPKEAIETSQTIAQSEPLPEENSNLPTTVIEANNKKDVYTDIYRGVHIKNESQYSLTEEMVTPNLKYANTKDIIIYHTHTCESYTPSENSQYVATGNYRTTDPNYSVARVGEELTQQLAGKGYTVIHDKTFHDYPAYTGSYTRSLSTIKNLLATYKNVECVFDVHRDALGSNSNYAPCVQIGEEKVAQLMFVMGTDGGGLEHSNWNRNLKLAIKIQEKANEMYPGLFKPIVLRNSRYNQHVTSGSAIIEVGATGNTLEQCNGSMKYLANVIDCVMKDCANE